MLDDDLLDALGGVTHLQASSIAVSEARTVVAARRQQQSGAAAFVW
jgi:hypothetical protein